MLALQSDGSTLSIHNDGYFTGPERKRFEGSCVYARPKFTDPIHWRRGELLGSGAFGKVYLVRPSTQQASTQLNTHASPLVFSVCSFGHAFAGSAHTHWRADGRQTDCSCAHWRRFRPGTATPPPSPPSAPPARSLNLFTIHIPRASFVLLSASARSRMRSRCCASWSIRTLCDTGAQSAHRPSLRFSWSECPPALLPPPHHLPASRVVSLALAHLPHLLLLPLLQLLRQVHSRRLHRQPVEKVRPLQ